MNKAGERLINGLAKENPTFVLMLGMCPTLAVTTSAMNGLGMGLTTMVVLALSNLMISLLRKIIPNRVRIPAFIVIIASFVTAVQLLLEGYLPDLNKSLGVYIPLIVVNCIILGRAESYAYSNPPIPSFFDGIGMGLGFTVALTCIGVVRELLGAGELFGTSVMPASFVPIRIFGQAPGAFFVLAVLVAIQNLVKESFKKRGKPYEKIGSGCSEDCMNCSDTGCARRFYDDGGENKVPGEVFQVGQVTKEDGKTHKSLKERDKGLNKGKDKNESKEKNKGKDKNESKDKYENKDKNKSKDKNENKNIDGEEETNIVDASNSHRNQNEMKDKTVGNGDKPDGDTIPDENSNALSNHNAEALKPVDPDAAPQSEDEKISGDNKPTSQKKRTKKKKITSDNDKRTGDDTREDAGTAEIAKSIIPIEEDEDLEILDLEEEE